MPRAEPAQRVTTDVQDTRRRRLCALRAQSLNNARDVSFIQDGRTTVCIWHGIVPSLWLVISVQYMPLLYHKSSADYNFVRTPTNFQQSLDKI